MTANIDFNTVAVTFLTKALSVIVVKESRRSGRRRTPGPEVIKRLAESGDIRSAVSTLEFLCLRGDESDDNWSAKIAFTKPKGGGTGQQMTKQEMEALKLIGNRENTLNIFHAVGRVLYNKRVDAPGIPQPPFHLPQYARPKTPEKDPDNLLLEIGTDISTFVASLHENYPPSCFSTSSEERLDAMNECLNALSDADLLAPDRFGESGGFRGVVDRNRMEEMAFEVAVRGILFALPSPVNRAAGVSLAPGGRRIDPHKMLYPMSAKIWRRKDEIEGTFDLVLAGLQGLSDAENTKGKDGVEGWRRNFANETPSAQASVEGVEGMDGSGAASVEMLASSSAAKTQMLLERLPYASKIFQDRKDVSSSLRERISTLTSFDGLAVSAEDEDDADDDDGAETEWTDRPDGDGVPNQSKKGIKGKGKNMFDVGTGSTKGEREGGGLNIPVEHAVERLVLLDDDIED